MEDSPEWLPSGWIMEIKTYKSGSKVGSNYKCYISPTGCKFYSKVEVFRYIKNGELDSETPKPKKRSSSDNPVVPMEDSSKWLPSGWITEIRAIKEGAKAGSRYKRYISPNGFTFYSKGEVLHYLKNGTPTRKKRSFADNVVARIENSPDWLPPGWTKEIKFRMRQTGDGFRQDPYYIDPVTGCKFRSKRDVFRYLETGESGKHVIRPTNGELGKHVIRATKRSIDDDAQSMQDKCNPSDEVKRQKLAEAATSRSLVGSCSLNSDGIAAEQIKRRKLAEAAARRSLFGNPNLNSDRIASEPISGSLSEEHTGNKKLNRGGLGAGPSSITPQNAEPERRRTRGAKNQLGPQSAEPKRRSGRRPKNQLGTTGPLDKQPIESESNNPLRNGVPLELKEETTVENAPLLELEEKKQPENRTSPKSEKKKAPENGPRPLEVEEKQSDNGVEAKNGPENGMLPLKVKDKHPSDKGVPSESKDSKAPENEQPLLVVENKESDKGDPNGVPLLNGVPLPSENGASTELGDHMPLSNGVPSELEMKILPENQAENHKIGTGCRPSRKLKDKKMTTLPRRSSKRLAGIEAELPPDLMNLNRVHPPSAKWKDYVGVDPAVGLRADPAVGLTQEKFEGENHLLGQPDAGLGEKLDDAEKLSGEKPDSPLVFPFGDSWPDPCLEFAFKTLTGAIPVAEDTLAIEDYFQQQLSMSHSQNNRSSACGLDALFQSDILFQLDSPEKGTSLPPPENNGLPCFFENVLKPNENENENEKDIARNTKGES
ncbi:uncharacterized protein LOC143882194 [Tasmannia lanceolata]|uniref:uncharacterized protein LOC143882194 n=1 Tax=Tasmannia lanceolata TaxID=3420 RepID=UPI00406376E1